VLSVIDLTSGVPNAPLARGAFCLQRRRRRIARIRALGSFPPTPIARRFGRLLDDDRQELPQSIVRFARVREQHHHAIVG